MKVQELREILKPLSADAIRRLAGQLDIEARTKAELLDAIASRYARRPAIVLEKLRRDDLYQCLKDWTCETEHGEFGFANLSSSNASELRAMASRLWVENWRPSKDGERVIASSEITALLLAYVGDDLDLSGLWSRSNAEEEIAGDEGRSAYEDLPTLGESVFDGARKGLAPFQQEAVVKLARRLESGRRRALLCLPTGGGKTRTALHLLLTRYVSEGKKVLWVTHRLDLLDQVHEEIREGVWQISRRRPSVRVSHVYGGATDISGDFILASSMSLVRNEDVLAALNRDRALAIVVYDEAHRLVAESTWTSIQYLLQGERALLGLTATPYRKNPQETLLIKQVLGKPAYYRSFADLLKTGFLARPEFIRMRMRSTEGLQLSEKDLRETRRVGEFAPAVLSALARDRERDKEIVSHWCANQRKYGKTIAFACDIEHADQLARTFVRHGVLSESLHSQQSPESRQRALANFRQGSTAVLVNVGILTEGTNVPDTKTVLLARPTLSRSLYMQMIGRGARGPNAVQGKTVFYVIDCVDNFQQHGFTSVGSAVAQELEDALRFGDGIAAGSDSVHDYGDPSHPPQVPAGITRAGRAIAALRLLLRGLTPFAYTLWGELRWGGSEGEEVGAAAVFLETRGHVEAALQRLRTAKQSENFDRMDPEGLELDMFGALRREEWTAAWTSYRDGGPEPELVEVAPGSIDAETLALAGHIEALVNQHPEWTADEWLTHLSSDPNSNADMVAVFGGVGACAAMLARTGLELQGLRHSEELTDNTVLVRSFEQDAIDFSTIAFALLPRGASEIPPEVKIIDTSCGLLFGRNAVIPDSWQQVTDDQVRVAAARLGDGISSDRGAEEMDHLIRVVLADKEVNERERRVLHLVAPFLGVPEEVLAGRLAGIEEPDAEVARELRENSGSITCGVCDVVLPEGSHFCGICGNPLGRLDRPGPGTSEPPPAETKVEIAVNGEAVEVNHGAAIAPMEASSSTTGASEEAEGDFVSCASCRAIWPRGSRFCGSCASKIATADRSAGGSTQNASGSCLHETPPEVPEFETRVVRHAGNPREGFAAEDWLHGLLDSEFGRDQVLRHVRPLGRGESDFVIQCRDAQFHIELKHVAQRNGSFHWSELQVDISREIPKKGHGYAYSLVIAHPRAGGGYQLFWCADPSAVFHDVPKTTVYHCTHYVEHASHDVKAGWRREAPVVDLGRLRWSVGFVIPLHERCYASMREIAAGESPVAPVVEWREGVAER